MRYSLQRRLWLGMALLSLALSGCGVATHVQRPAAPRATATTTPLASLAWTPVKVPTSFTAPGTNLAISPVDGHDAWMCQSTSATTYVIWKTTDAGQSWRQTGRFSYTAPMAGASCGLSADQTGTSALLATIGWGCGECGTLAAASLFSADGATHWRPLAGDVQNGEFATVPGGVIAIMDKSPATQQGETQYLAFSADGFRTWRARSSQGLPTGFFHFAISPDGSTLIGSGYNGTLWRSGDLGAHWTRLSSPHGQTGLTAWLPQRST
ncbi:MAG: WD40/YVTN/BNR-like repeat-containing protein, partial [Nitrososphaerota archaeon]